MPDLSAKSQSHQGTPRGGYEPRDVNAKWIFGIVAFLVVAGLVMHFCLAGVIERMQKKPSPQDHFAGLRREETALAKKAIPHLQIAPAEDLKKFREREDVELTTYDWIDRPAGVVRIPIDRAMELVLQRGLPVGSSTNIKLGQSSYQLQQQRSQRGNDKEE